MKNNKNRTNNSNNNNGNNIIIKTSRENENPVPVIAKTLAINNDKKH